MKVCLLPDHAPGGEGFVTAGTFRLMKQILGWTRARFRLGDGDGGGLAGIEHRQLGERAEPSALAQLPTRTGALVSFTQVTVWSALPESAADTAVMSRAGA